MQKLFLLLLLTYILKTTNTLPRTLAQKNKLRRQNKKKFSLTPVFTAGIEMECTIPSGPFPGGDQILIQTDRWEIHPDTPKHGCNCAGRTRCINMEFATIGGLDQREFKESIIDAGTLFYNFFIYGFNQKFLKGKDFRFGGQRKIGSVLAVEKKDKVEQVLEKVMFKGMDFKNNESLMNNSIVQNSADIVKNDSVINSDNIIKGIESKGTTFETGLDKDSLLLSKLQSSVLKKNDFISEEEELSEMESIREKKSMYYANEGEFIKVKRSFQVQDTPHMQPGKNGTFNCVPQVTISLFRHLAYPIFVKYVEIFVNPNSTLFDKAFNGKITETIFEANKGLLFLSHFRIKYKNFSIFEKGENMAKSFAFLIVYYFANLFRPATTDLKKEARKLELKYHLGIMTRISFSDMFDNLIKSSRIQICRFILKLCSNFTKEEIKEFSYSKTECKVISPTNLTQCDQFVLFDYKNEESGFIHPIEDETRLTFSLWLNSIVNPEYREPVNKLRTEKDDVEIIKTDLLSPPSGLRSMSRNEKKENHMYHYGMGKYILKNKSQFLVELRSVGRIANMEEKKNYREKMNKVYNFMYHSNNFETGMEEDLWAGEDENRELENLEVFEPERVI